MKIIRHQQDSVAAASPTPPLPAATAELSPIMPIRKDSSPFLSIPVEIRLEIYDLCFFRDVHRHPQCTRQWVQGNEVAFPENLHNFNLLQLNHQIYHKDFNLLLLNHQIYHEAKDIAYAAQRQQLIRTHRIYHVCPTSQHNNSKLSKWVWDLESQFHWQPSCRSAKALAQLRLPKLGLAIRVPVGDNIRDQLSIREQLSALEAFFRSLVYHLRDENVTESIEIYLQPQLRES